MSTPFWKLEEEEYSAGAAQQPATVTTEPDLSQNDTPDCTVPTPVLIGNINAKKEGE